MRYDNCSLVSLGSTGVNFQCMMLQDGLDETFGLQVGQCSACQGGPDLQSFTDDCRGDEFVAGHFLLQLVVRGLVKQSQIIQLVSHFSLRPFLKTKVEVAIVNHKMLLFFKQRLQCSSNLTVLQLLSTNWKKPSGHTLRATAQDKNARFVE